MSKTKKIVLGVFAAIILALAILIYSLIPEAGKDLDYLLPDKGVSYLRLKDPVTIYGAEFFRKIFTSAVIREQFGDFNYDQHLAAMKKSSPPDLAHVITKDGDESAHIWVLKAGFRASFITFLYSLKARFSDSAELESHRGYTIIRITDPDHSLADHYLCLVKDTQVISTTAEAIHAIIDRELAAENTVSALVKEKSRGNPSFFLNRTAIAAILAGGTDASARFLKKGLKKFDSKKAGAFLTALGLPKEFDEIDASITAAASLRLDFVMKPGKNPVDSPAEKDIIVFETDRTFLTCRSFSGRTKAFALSKLKKDPKKFESTFGITPETFAAYFENELFFCLHEQSNAPEEQQSVHYRDVPSATLVLRLKKGLAPKSRDEIDKVIRLALRKGNVQKHAHGGTAITSFKMEKSAFGPTFLPSYAYAGDFLLFASTLDELKAALDSCRAGKTVKTQAGRFTFVKVDIAKKPDAVFGLVKTLYTEWDKKRDEKARLADKEPYDKYLAVLKGLLPQFEALTFEETVTDGQIDGSLELK